MNLKKLSKLELEQYSYNDLTYEILKNRKKKMTTNEIFKEICELLDYSEQYYYDAIADYYTSLNLDKRFKLLDNQKWDLRENYPKDGEEEIEADDEDEDEDIEEEEEVEEEEADEEEENFDDEDDEEEDELAELTIIGEEEMDELEE